MPPIRQSTRRKQTANRPIQRSNHNDYIGIFPSLNEFRFHEHIVPTENEEFKCEIGTLAKYKDTLESLATATPILLEMINQHEDLGAGHEFDSPRVDDIRGDSHHYQHKDGIASLCHPYILAALCDKISGSMIGSALGDTVGLFTEFLNKRQAAEVYRDVTRFSLIDPVTPFYMDCYRSGIPDRHWSDDTDHALLILLSFLHHNGTICPDDFAKRLRIWIHHGTIALRTMPLGLGTHTRSVVIDRDFLRDHQKTAHRLWKESNYQSAPNGSLMRIHPLGAMCIHKDLEEAFEIAATNSLVTHPDPRCVISCVIAVGLVRGLIRGDTARESDIDGMITMGIDWYAAWRRQRGLESEQDDARGVDPNREDPQLDEELLWEYVSAESFEALKLDEAGAIGYVYKCLGSGIYALRCAMRDVSELPENMHTDIFENIMTDLVMEAGDADTNACCAGALLGAYLGHKAIPESWKQGLRYGSWLAEKVDYLCQLLAVKSGDYDGTEDEDTRPDGGREGGLFTSLELQTRWEVYNAEVEARKKLLRGQSRPSTN